MEAEDALTDVATIPTITTITTTTITMVVVGRNQLAKVESGDAMDHGTTRPPLDSWPDLLPILPSLMAVALPPWIPL